MYIGRKEGKVFDIVSELCNKRDSNLDDKNYIFLEKMPNMFIDDTWDFKKNINLKDAPMRFIEPQKSKIELLEIEISDLKTKYNELKDIITKK